MNLELTIDDEGDVTLKVHVRDRLSIEMGMAAKTLEDISSVMPIIVQLLPTILGANGPLPWQGPPVGPVYGHDDECDYPDAACTCPPAGDDPGPSDHP